MYNLWASIFIFYFGFYLVSYERRIVFGQIITQRRGKSYYKKNYQNSNIIRKLVYLNFRQDIPKLYYIFNAIYVLIGLLFIFACGVVIVLNKWNELIFYFACSKFAIDIIVLIWIQIKTKYGHSKFKA